MCEKTAVKLFNIFILCAENIVIYSKQLFLSKFCKNLLCLNLFKNGFERASLGELSEAQFLREFENFFRRKSLSSSFKLLSFKRWIMGTFKYYILSKYVKLGINLNLEKLF